jgi:MFS family permease
MPADPAATVRPRLGAAFARVWTAATLSNLADGVLKLAIPVLAVRFTDSPLLVAGVGFAMSLPWLLFALHAGAIADRVDRRRAMLLANIGRAAVVALLAVAAGTGAGALWMLYAAGLLIGLAEVFYDTSSQSILPQVVGRDALPTANSRLYMGELAANNFVGPPLGGVLVAAGAALALGAPAALWALAVLALASVRGTFRAERTGPRTSLAADIREGFGYLIHHRVLRAMAAMTGTSNCAGSMAGAEFVLYAVGPASPMGLTEPEFGLLNTSVAIGSVLGSLFATRLATLLGRARSLALGVALTTLMLATPAVTTSPWAIGAVWALAGAGIALWNVIVVSLRQQITPDELLGRMNSCYRLLAWGMIPVGSLVGGLLAEAVGLRMTFAVSAVVGALTFLGLLVVREHAIEAAEAEAAVG